MQTELSTATFNQIREFAYRNAGIIIGPEKRAMVVSRLWPIRLSKPC